MDFVLLVAPRYAQGHAGPLEMNLRIRGGFLCATCWLCPPRRCEGNALASAATQSRGLLLEAHQAPDELCAGKSRRVLNSRACFLYDSIPRAWMRLSFFRSCSVKSAAIS